MMKYFATFILLFTVAAAFSQAPDSLRKNKRSPFSDVQELTSSDYLAAIDRANDLMNTIHEEGEFRAKTTYTFQEIANTNAAIKLISQNVNDVGNTNVRNQRMYEKVLTGLQADLARYQRSLDDETNKITALKKKLRTVMKDTVFRKLVRDTVVRAQFKDKLAPLRAKFFATDSILKQNLSILNTHKSDNTSKKIVVSEAVVVVNERLEKSGLAMFKSEFPPLWDTDVKIRNQNTGSFIAQKFSVEAKAFSYYFTYKFGNTLFLLLVMGLLFWFVHYNLASVKAYDKLSVLTDFKFRAINRGTLLPVLIIALNIGIALNVYAPAVYIEFLHALLLLVLSLLFVSRWPAAAYRNWLLLVAVFLALSFIDLFLKVTLLQRLLFIAINIICIRFGLVYLKQIKEQLFVKILFKPANIIFIGCNALAILFNLFGRVSLAYTLSLTAIIAITQMVALSVMLRLLIEILILQVLAIRLRRGITKLFDVEALEKNIAKPLVLVAIYMWLAVMASNLNLSDTLYEWFGHLANRQNKIGSFSFTFGGILLFIFIIWLAHLLQKLASYFFGGIDGEYGESINKRQHSRLLITRLTLLVAGYLLAIAASGMPLDKITIVLGALGVGVGLGLQSVVSNFVSGVILIFERPIQIGDIIDSGAQSGTVKEIGLRTTRLKTNDGAEVIIPNGNILSQNIVNWTRTDNYRQLLITFSLSGEITQQQIQETVTEVIGKMEDADQNTPPAILFESATGKKYKVRVRFWGNIYRTEQVLSETRMALYEAFAKKEVAMED